MVFPSADCLLREKDIALWEELGGGTEGPFITPRGIGGWDTLQRVLFQALPLEAEEYNPSYSIVNGHVALPCCISAQKCSLGPGARHMGRNRGNCCPPQKNCVHVGGPRWSAVPQALGEEFFSSFGWSHAGQGDLEEDFAKG